MPRTVDENYQYNLEHNVSQTSYLWEITRTDSTAYYFTDHDKDIDYDGNTYVSLWSADMSSIEQKAELSPDNFDFNVILNTTQISKNDLIAGLFDHAAITVYLVDRSLPGYTAISMITGRLGQVQIPDDHKATIEFRSLAQLLSQGIGRTYTHECDVDLGDSKCGITLGSYTFTGTVTSVIINQVFEDSTMSQANSYFNYGLLTWTSGDNNGISMEIKSYVATGGSFTLASPMPFTIQIGDGYSASAGCDKTKATCRDTFYNIINFRGFAEIPGMDKVNRIPDKNKNAGLHD